MSSYISYSQLLASDYQRKFDTMIIAADKSYLVDAAVNKINAGKAQYEAIAAATGVPWVFIGMVHYRESNCDFNRHLHNGDPLTGRTVQVPSGRPATGTPPFTFFESAIDALQYQKLTGLTDWSVSAMLYRLEAYNGFGYKVYHNIDTPYLWSFTNFYTKGLYVKDGIFDSNAVSNQVGVAPILRRVMEKNNLYAAVVTFSTGAVLLVIGIFYLLYQNSK